LVIRYSYLWVEDHRKGLEEGRKDRPCAVVLVSQTSKNERRITVLPVTHAPPADPAMALEIPRDTKARLGLDNERSWVVLSEANQFIWPGPDLRPAAPGKTESIVYGQLPQAFFYKLRERFLTLLRKNASAAVSRTE